MLSNDPPRGREAIERFLLDELPSLGPPPRGQAGLARARRFFDRLGNPQDATRQIHVVGTAGKGAAVAAIVGRLVGAGASVGAHLSPHVYDLRERFLLGGALPAWPLVDDAMSRLWPALTEMDRADGRPPGFFEVTAALAWLVGEAAGVDYFVTEAGIGGELDATNAIAGADKVTVMTPIGYDHLDILGTDLAGIARTKAGVIPAGGSVVLAPQPSETAELVVRGVVDERRATLHEVPWRAGWQAQADAVARLVVELLGRDPTAPPAPVHLPGRMEEVPAAHGPLLLDGAHNPLKLRALRRALARRPDVALVALSHEKDLDACARELAQLAPVVVTTDFAVAAGDRVVRRSWSAKELGDAVGRARPDVVVLTQDGIEAALRVAEERAGEGGLVLATGSFMMLEPVRAAASLVRR